jgi:tetratricopeptide (TPR) repeat protein
MTDDQKISITILNKNFTQSFMLINTLLRLESSTEDDKQEFLLLCKKDYKIKKNQLNLIDEFREIYKPENVLWWYTRESFFYRTLDKILRSTTEHFEQLLLSRSFITDIYEQLKQNQYQSSIRVYSGQLMWSGEIEYLRNDKSRYLSINTFWLTNINRNKVVDLLTNTKRSTHEHQVLFIIDADPNLDTSKPFADISKFCHFDEKGEILFMIGTIFRIIETIQDGQMQVVRLELCGDHEQLNESMEIIDGNERINFRTFGDLLYQMELYDLAERMYRQVLAKLPSNDSTCSDLYFALGAVSKCKKEYDSSLKFYEKSLKNKLRTDRSDYIMIGKLHACIGEIHRLKDNDKEALKCFEKAIEIYTKEQDEYHHHMADFYDNAASICKRLKKNNDALDYYKKALAVDEKPPSSNSLGAAKSHNNIGIIYCLLNQYDLALVHYQYSLAIKLNIHPSPQLSIAKSYVNIASVYKTNNDLAKALDYYQKAAIIYQRLSPTEDPDRIQINNEIQMISQRQ